MICWRTGKINIHRLIQIGNWVQSHKRPLLVHGLILSGFVLYSLFLAGPLFNRFETIHDEARLVQMPLPAETNNMRYGLDRLITSPSALEVQGWAFIEGNSAENNRTYVILKSAQTSYIFDTFAVFDNPVTAQYGGPNLNLDWSGFTATIPLRKIEKGDYRIGLCIARDEITGLEYSSKVIVKSNGKVKITELN